MVKYWNKPGSFALLQQPVKEKKKPDLVLYPAHSEGVGGITENRIFFNNSSQTLPGAHPGCQMLLVVYHTKLSL